MIRTNDMTIFMNMNVAISMGTHWVWVRVNGTGFLSRLIKIEMSRF
jgi:hypothetical protein